MSSRSNMVEADVVIEALVQELAKLKSATEQIGDAGSTAQLATGSAEAVVRASAELTNSARSTLEAIENVKLGEWFAKFQEMESESVSKMKALIDIIEDAKVKDRLDAIQRMATASAGIQQSLVEMIEKIGFEDRLTELQHTAEESLQATSQVEALVQRHADEAQGNWKTLLDLCLKAVAQGSSIVEYVQEAQLDKRLVALERKNDRLAMLVCFLLVCQTITLVLLFIR